jgi:2-amino-4-hydroxy-6-hydroxymethyldihydropteridine diphosphokinase
MPDVYVGLGSNLDPQRHLNEAIGGLEQRFGPIRRSAVYRSPAHGRTAADYWNLVAGWTAACGVAALQIALEELESAAGRVRPSSACSLDLDLLVYGRRVEARLRVPRDDVLRRAYVLGPLAELAPELRHPVTGAQVGRAWQALVKDAALLRLGHLEELAPAD